MYVITVVFGWDQCIQHSGDWEEVNEFENGIRRDFLSSQIVAVWIKAKK